MMSDHARPEKPVLMRAARLMNKARDAFYDRRYEESVERCQETLEILLPAIGDQHAPSAPPTPDELAGRFFDRYAASLPILEAERVAAVFTFFVRRKARFSYERGRPLPRREWYEFLQVSREDASEVLTATRLALEAVQRGTPPAP
jgi:HEPN domain-containing protein